jgi:WD40 repeat protein
VWTIVLSLDRKKLVSRSEDGAVKLWDIDTRKVIGRWIGHTKFVRTICWSQDGQRALSRSFYGTARQWDVESGEAVLKPVKTGNEWVCTNSFRIAVMTSLELSSPKSKSGTRACHYS